MALHRRPQLIFFPVAATDTAVPTPQTHKVHSPLAPLCYCNTPPAHTQMKKRCHSQIAADVHPAAPHAAPSLPALICAAEVSDLHAHRG
jgi:hypothetical protein